MHAKIIKQDNKLGLWTKELVAEANIECTQLALQMTSLTAAGSASLIQTLFKN